MASRAGQVVLLRFLLHLIDAVALLRMVLGWKRLMSEYVLDMVTFYLDLLLCLFLFESATAVPMWILGTEANPQSNMPFSLVDFWGWRWNLLVNNLLCVCVYELVLRLLNGRTKPTRWDRVLPPANSFLVSGLMHDVLYFYGSHRGFAVFL